MRNVLTTYFWQILPEQNGVKSEKEENQIESAKASPDNESKDVEGDNDSIL